MTVFLFKGLLKHEVIQQTQENRLYLIFNVPVYKTITLSLKTSYKAIWKAVLPIMFQSESCVRFRTDILNIYIQLLTKTVCKLINVSSKIPILYSLLFSSIGHDIIKKERRLRPPFSWVYLLQ